MSLIHPPSRITPAATAPAPSGTWQAWVLIALAAAAPLTLFGQTAGAVGEGYFFRRPSISLTLRGGYDRPTAGSDIFDFSAKNLTLNKGDFATSGYQVDLGIRVNNRTELVFAAGTSQKAIPSEFRKFVDNNDLPIEQTTRLRRLPVTVGVKYALTAPEERLSRFVWIPSRFTPWVGAGVGAMNYTFSQIGDFVDFQTLNVFRQEYASSGWAPMGYANVGADLRLTTRFSLTGDVRYSVARAGLGGKFVGFRPIDLSGTAATMGFTVRL